VGIDALRTRNSFAATAFCSYGAFWLAVGTIFTPASGILAAYNAATLPPALGFFFLSWTIFTVLMTLATLRTNWALITVFVLLSLTFLLLTLGAFGAGTTVIGGWLGILTALVTAPLVWYTATHRFELVMAPASAVANPIPLGLSALALTTFVLSADNARLISAPNIVLGLALFYGGLVQLIAGVLAFRVRNTFAAIAFCIHSVFWIALGLALWQNLFLNIAVVTYFLVAWTIFAALAGIVSLKTNIAFIAASFLSVFLTLLFLALGALGGGTSIFGGYLGMLTALVAWYTALALLLVETQSPFRLPVGSRSRG